MSSQEIPKITFPCNDYPIRIIGNLNTPENQKVILSIIKQYDPLNKGCLSIKQSKHGNFQSMLFSIFATGEQQLFKLNRDLKATGLVKIVL